MTLPAELMLHMDNPAGIAAAFFRTNDEEGLWKLTQEALFHYARDPGWLEVEAMGSRWYACRVVTFPFLIYLSRRIPGRLAAAFSERARTFIHSDTGRADPEIWILLSQKFLGPLPRPGVNLWQAGRLKAGLEKSVMVTAQDAPDEAVANNPIMTGSPVRLAGEVQTKIISKLEAPAQESLPDEGEKNEINPPSKGRKKRSDSPDEDKVLQLLLQGRRVKEICTEMKCSEAYVYKLIKIRRGMSAMEYRWLQWQMVSDMYHGEPKKTLNQIEEACGLSRAAVYNAVKKIAFRDGLVLFEEKHDRKLSKKDVEVIKKKLAEGTLRKDILSEFSITTDTLIKYVGHSDDYRVIPPEVYESVVRLRMQGKTLQATADILGVSIGVVKKAWKEKKNAPETKKMRVKYDNRNPLSKRDRDQAVNAVLKGGHTRVQIYKQYGINALTLRRYIRAAQKEEEEKLRRKEAREAKKKKED